MSLVAYWEVDRAALEEASNAETLSASEEAVLGDGDTCGDTCEPGEGVESEEHVDDLVKAENAFFRIVAR